MGKDVVSQSVALKERRVEEECRQDGSGSTERWSARSSQATLALGGECESDRDDWQEIRTVTCARSAARAVSASL